MVHLENNSVKYESGCNPCEDTEPSIGSKGQI